MIESNLNIQGCKILQHLLLQVLHGVGLEHLRQKSRSVQPFYLNGHDITASSIISAAAASAFSSAAANTASAIISAAAATASTIISTAAASATASTIISAAIGDAIDHGTRRGGEQDELSFVSVSIDIASGVCSSGSSEWGFGLISAG